MDDIQKETLHVIAEAIHAGDVAFFLGAGANRCGRPEGMVFDPRKHECLPDGAELAEYLAGIPGFPWADKKNDLLRASEYVAVMEFPRTLYRKLHSVFDWNFEPTAVHKLVASLPRRGNGHQLVVTTNYDDLMERAFRDAQETFDLVWYVAPEKDKFRGRFLHLAHGGGAPKPIRKPNEYQDISLLDRSLVLKVHGQVSREARTPSKDSYVITEDDYIDYLARNPQLPAVIISELKERSLVFLGYSLNDWNMRILLKRLWEDQSLPAGSWAVMKNPTDFEVKYWSKRDVTILHMPLEDFTSELEKLL